LLFLFWLSIFIYYYSYSSRPPGSSVVNPTPGPRRYLIGGNWKCNGTLASNAALISLFNDAGPIPDNVDVVICAPYPYLSQCVATMRDDIEIGGQDCAFTKDAGAYTGEVSASQLLDIGCTWVIVGHSERRQGFGFMVPGESERHCATKAKVALDCGLKVMFAIGEQKEERENGTTMTVCAEQLEPLVKILADSPNLETTWNNIAIAYEPVWAIGTGLTATPEMAQETHAEIRSWLADHVSPEVASKMIIQYGGSMKGANAQDLLAQPDIDGGLIGGASLMADFFNVINGVPK
jgi:triosephosphate isomerase (TIM)